MGVVQSRTRLQQNYRELMLRWEKANACWNDKVSEDIKKTYLDPLGPKINVAMDAMEKMSKILSKVKRECE